MSLSSGLVVAAHLYERLCKFFLLIRHRIFPGSPINSLAAIGTAIG